MNDKVGRALLGSSHLAIKLCRVDPNRVTIWSVKCGCSEELLILFPLSLGYILERIAFTTRRTYHPIYEIARSAIDIQEITQHWIVVVDGPLLGSNA